MSGQYDDVYAVYDERFPVARTPHRCGACGETIAARHRYARVGAIVDGHASTIVRCLRCQTIHEHLRTLGDRDMWPDERLDCGEEYRGHWGHDPPEHIAALAFATPDEVQAACAKPLEAQTGALTREITALLPPSWCPMRGAK